MQDSVNNEAGLNNLHHGARYLHREYVKKFPYLDGVDIERTNYGISLRAPTNKFN